MERAAGRSKAVTAWARSLSSGFERVIVLTLMCLLMIVVIVSTVELGWLLFKDLSSVGTLLLDPEEMFELFGFFLLVLIGVELLTTLKYYLSEGVIHVEVVLEVGLIALAQKVLILDTSRATAMYLFGLASLILALAAAFWWVRTARGRAGPPGLPGA